MQTTTYSKFRQNLKTFLDKVLSSRAPILVTRSKGEDVVVISKSDYESLQETLYLLSSPKNSERIAQAIKDYEGGKVKPQDIIQ